MEKITMFIMKSCPYCQKALSFHERLFEERPELKDVPIEIIDEREQKALADSFDYYYVPTYYVKGKKLHEGAAEYDDVKAVFEAALNG